MPYVILYLAAITIANLAVAVFGPSILPYTAFFLIGLDLICRDHLHERWTGMGRWPRLAALIAAGSLISWLISLFMPSQLPPDVVARVARASFIAFAAAGAADTVVYHVLRRYPWLTRANGSNVVSAAVDSALFPLLAFNHWSLGIFLAQFLAKVGGGAIWSLVLRPWRRRTTAEPVI